MGRIVVLAARIWVAAFVRRRARPARRPQWAGADASATVSQWALMPVLAGALVAATRWPRGHLVTWVLVALGFSWLGDLAAVARRRRRRVPRHGRLLPARPGGVRRRVRAGRPALRAAPSARAARCRTRAVLVVLVGGLRGGAGGLLVPVAVYGGCLTAMAVLATGVGRLAGVGGAVFLVSDGLIALERSCPSWDLPDQDFWVMLTYVAGQALSPPRSSCATPQRVRPSRVPVARRQPRRAGAGQRGRARLSDAGSADRVHRCAERQCRTCRAAGRARAARPAGRPSPWPRPGRRRPTRGSARPRCAGTGAPGRRRSRAPCRGRPRTA